MIATRPKSNQINEEQVPILYENSINYLPFNFPEVPMSIPSVKQSSIQVTCQPQPSLQQNIVSPVVDVEKEPPTFNVDIPKTLYYSRHINDDDFFEQEFKLNIKDESVFQQQKKEQPIQSTTSQLNYHPPYFSSSSSSSSPPLPQQQQTIAILPDEKIQPIQQTSQLLSPPQQQQQPAVVALPHCETAPVTKFDISNLSFEEQMNFAVKLSLNESNNMNTSQPKTPQYVPRLEVKQQPNTRTIEMIDYYGDLKQPLPENSNIIQTENKRNDFMLNPGTIALIPEEEQIAIACQQSKNQTTQTSTRVQIISNPQVDALSQIPSNEENINTPTKTKIFFDSIMKSVKNTFTNSEKSLYPAQQFAQKEKNERKSDNGTGVAYTNPSVNPEINIFQCHNCKQLLKVNKRVTVADCPICSRRTILVRQSNQFSPTIFSWLD